MTRQPSPLVEAGARAVEVARRLEAVRAALRERAARAGLLQSRRNFAWLTVGGSNHVVVATEVGATAILVTEDRAFVLAPTNEAPRIADEEVAGLPLEVVEVPWYEPEAILDAARRLSGGSFVPEAALEAALRSIRSRLSPLEHDRLAWLGERLSKSLSATLPGVEAGEPEDHVAARLLGTLASSGIRLPVLLAAADGRIERYRHPLPGEARVRRRLMVVAVAERWGLHVALTGFRDLAPPDPLVVERMAAAREVLAAMIEATRPGQTFGDVFAAAREAYRRLGSPDEWRRHHQGGSIGYAPREAIAVPDDPSPVLPGMAFAWNPSLPGAKAEATIVIGWDGSRRIVASF